MKKFTLIILSLLVSTQIFAKGSSKPKQDDHSHHAEHGQAKLELNNGQKWSIDQVMFDNMSAIINENNKVIALGNNKKTTKVDYNKLSDLIAEKAEVIVTKCELTPKADEVFHVILADLYIVSEHMKDAKTPAHAMEKLATTLSSYLEYFNHQTLK